MFELGVGVLAGSNPGKSRNILGLSMSAFSRMAKRSRNILENLGIVDVGALARERQHASVGVTAASLDEAEAFGDV